MNLKNYELSLKLVRAGVAVYMFLVKFLIVK
jgi:hypothetical protein